MTRTLRTQRLARFVLLAYALVLAAGLLSPAFVAGDVQVVCLGNGGVKLVAVNEDGSGETVSSSAMACPLCQIVGPPPIVVATTPPSQVSLAEATRPAVIARLTALAGAPMPARGPHRA